MSVINDLIRTEENGTLSFGNTELPAKAKLDGYEYNGDLYKIKTFKEITKLEKTEPWCMNLFPVQLYTI